MFFLLPILLDVITKCLLLEILRNGMVMARGGGRVRAELEVGKGGGWEISVIMSTTTTTKTL